MMGRTPGQQQTDLDMLLQAILAERANGMIGGGIGSAPIPPVTQTELGPPQAPMMGQMAPMMAGMAGRQVPGANPDPGMRQQIDDFFSRGPQDFSTFEAGPPTASGVGGFDDIPSGIAMGMGSIRARSPKAKRRPSFSQSANLADYFAGLFGWG